MNRRRPEPAAFGAAAGERADLVATLILASPSATALTRLSDGCFLECNDAMHDVIGYRRDELIGRTAIDLNMWSDLEERDVFARTLLERGHVAGHVAAFRTKSGETRIGAFSAWLVEHGGEPCVLGVISEPTERLWAERRARQAESRYRHLVERIPAITYIEALDADPSGFYMSPQIEDLLGFSPERFYEPDFWASSIHPEDRERAAAADRRSNETREPFREEYRFIGADGREVWVQDHAVLVDDPDGGDPYWLGVILEVGERKEAERRVAEAEDRYRSLVEQIPVTVYVDAIDDVSTALYVSPQYERLLGYTPEERMNDPELWANRLHPEDRERVLAESIRTNRTLEPFRVEYRLRAKDGRVVWVRDEAEIVYDGQGRPTFWQGVLSDITEQKIAEGALRESEARYRQMWEDNRAVKILVDAASGAIIDANRAAADFYGRPVEELNRMRFTDLNALPPEQVRRRMEQVVAREVASCILHHRLASGEVREVEVFASPVAIHGRTLLYSIVYDITERRRAEEELREAELRFRTLVEQIPAMTYVYEETEVGSGNFVTTYVSPQIEPILGYPTQDWIEDHDLWVRILHPDDRQGVLDEEARTDATGEPFQMEFRVLAKDRSVVWVREEARVIRDQLGLPRQWLGLMFDVTARKNAEQQLAKSYELLRATDQERRRLLGRVVEVQEEERARIAADIHDDSIQKMTAVGLRLETFSRQLGEVEPEILTSLKRTVEDSIGRLRHLMFELRPAALDREGLESALKEVLQPLADEAGLRWTLENRLITEPRPPVRANAFRIVQEALANVRKHAGASAVDVRLEPRDGGVYVRVRDDGRGFEPAEIRSEPGHFGVSAMRERAELAGGWFRVTGAAGSGATLEFWLPDGDEPS